MKMSQKEWEDKLRTEGFDSVYIWEDGPSVVYPPHTHPVTTAHVVLNGKITISQDGRETTFKEGERIDVPAGKEHSAKVGPNGCVYIIGEKKA